MQLKHIRWVLILIPALLVGGFEFFRHRFFDGLPTAIGNLAAAALAVGGSLAYYGYTFHTVERLTSALRQEEKNKALAEERERIAGQLHDSMAQSLFFLNAELDQVSSALRAGDVAHAGRLVDDVRDGVRFADRDLREMIGALKRSSWDEPVVPAVRDVVASFRRQSGLETELHIPKSLPPMSTGTRYKVLTIVREALTNVRKHAGAHSVSVRISRSGERGLVVTVTDDGTGFDPATVDWGFGVREMRQAAASLGGQLTFDSSAGGTTVRLEIADMGNGGNRHAEDAQNNDGA